MNIFNITNEIMVSIVDNPELHFMLKTGTKFNNKLDKNRRYFNSKSIQFLVI